MFFFAMEEKLVLCRPFDQKNSRLPCSEALQQQCAACLSRGWLCVQPVCLEVGCVLS